MQRCSVLASDAPYDRLETPRHGRSTVMLRDWLIAQDVRALPDGVDGRDVPGALYRSAPRPGPGRYAFDGHLTALCAGPLRDTPLAEFGHFEFSDLLPVELPPDGLLTDRRDVADLAPGALVRTSGVVAPDDAFSLVVTGLSVRVLLPPWIVPAIRSVVRETSDDPRYRATVRRLLEDRLLATHIWYVSSIELRLRGTRRGIVSENDRVPFGFQGIRP